MSVAFYMDQHVPRAITAGLRLRGVDVMTAYEVSYQVVAEPLAAPDRLYAAKNGAGSSSRCTAHGRTNAIGGR